MKEAAVWLFAIEFGLEAALRVAVDHLSVEAHSGALRASVCLEEEAAVWLFAIEFGLLHGILVADEFAHDLVKGAHLVLGQLLVERVRLAELLVVRALGLRIDQRLLLRGELVAPSIKILLEALHRGAAADARGRQLPHETGARLLADIAQGTSTERGHEETGGAAGGGRHLSSALCSQGEARAQGVTTFG